MVRDRGMSERKFCQYLAINQAVLSTARKRNTIPGLSVMAKISSLTDVSINELIGVPSGQNTAAPSGITIPFMPQRFSCGPKENWLCDIETTTVTVMERMACGHPIDNLVAANVKGDSMEGANPPVLHSFRYYVNSKLVAAGIPNDVIQSIIGHSSDEMASHYSDIDLSRKKELCLAKLTSYADITSERST